MTSSPSPVARRTEARSTNRRAIERDDGGDDARDRRSDRHRYRLWYIAARPASAARTRRRRPRMDGWMDGCRTEPNHKTILFTHTKTRPSVSRTHMCPTVGQTVLFIHTSTYIHPPSVSQCVPVCPARASQCGINRTVYTYKHTHIHPSQCVRPSVSQCVCVPLWDKQYCLHIHTSPSQCVRPERRRRRRRHTHPPAGRATKASSTTVSGRRIGSVRQTTPTTGHRRTIGTAAGSSNERTNDRPGQEKRTQRGGRRARLDWIRF